MNDVSCDPIWEQKYAAGHAERYPWDSVVTFVFRNAPRDRERSDIHILEVGCGTASNLWFAAREGFQVAGVDAAESAIRFAQRRFADDGLQGDLRVADFTALPFENDAFDLVIDRGALTCCGKRPVSRALAEIHRVMKPGARFLFNPYSDRHSSFSSDVSAEDGLVTDISAGALAGVGQIRFYGRQDVLQALEAFGIVSLQHQESVDMSHSACWVHAEWRVIAEKAS